MTKIVIWGVGKYINYVIDSIKMDEYSRAVGSSSIIRFYSWNYTATIV